MKVSINVSKNISVPLVSLNGLWLAIAAGLRWTNRNHDDYELRGIMGEWTPDEARAEILSDRENAEENRRDGVFWSGG